MNNILFTFLPFFFSFYTQPAPRLVKALSRRSISHVAAGSEFSVAIDADEQVLAWGCADGGLVSFFANYC